METAAAMPSHQINTEAEIAEVAFFDTEKFFEEARRRMDIRLERIRGEEIAEEARIFQHANDYSRS